MHGTLKLWLNLTSSDMRLSISFLTMACRFWVSRCFSFVTKSRNVGIKSDGGCLYVSSDAGCKRITIATDLG